MTTPRAFYRSLGLALTAALTGCALGPIQPAASTPLAGTLSLQGRTFGGTQPIAGATIQVYAAGNTGYGSAATPLLVSTVTTDANGFFSITGKYSCTSVTTPVYVTATGGNPGLPSGTNKAIKLASAIGTCAQLQSASYVWINEVTTAATAFALGQYFTTAYGATSADSFGAPNTTQAQIGLTNAVNTVANLVNSVTGGAIASATITSTLGNITTTPEAAKLNTIADILASCINSDGTATSACQTTLFPDVTPTGATQPTDTLQAAVLMSLNPTSNNAAGSSSNLTALYGLSTASSPYPGVSTQPADWTVGINYSAGSTNTTGTLINLLTDLSVDSNGNLWIVNGNGIYSSLAEFSPTGTPLANPLNSGAAYPASLASSAPRNMAIDTLGNVFVATSTATDIFEWLPASQTSTYVNNTSSTYGISIDGSNNIYSVHNSYKSTATLDQFLNDTPATTTWVQYPQTGNIGGWYVAASSDGTAWISQGNNSGFWQASNLNGPTVCTTFPCSQKTTTTLGGTYTAATITGTPIFHGIAAAPHGVMWVANGAASAYSVSIYSSVTSSTSVGSTLSLNNPYKLALDGAGDMWVSNTGGAFVTEFNSTGTVLSPVGTTTATGFAHTGLSSGSTDLAPIAIDPSGNVWIGNYNGANINSFFEIVGAAAPAVTPISLALKNGTLGTRP